MTDSVAIFQTLTSAPCVFAGGPHPSYYPFSAIHVDALASDSFALITSEDHQSNTFPWLWNTLGSEEKTIPFTIKKYTEHPGDINLATVLQYGDGRGLIQLREITRSFTERVYQPAYEDWETFIDAGSTDAWVFDYSPLLGLLTETRTPGCGGFSWCSPILRIGFLLRSGLTR